MTTLLAAIFVASLFGSLHCAGMCGPFVAFCVGTEKQSTGRHVSVQCAYHGGRLICYSFLGLVGGALGAATDWGGEVLGLQKTAMIIAGAAMLLFGIVAALRLLGAPLRHLRIPSPISKVFMAGYSYAQTRHPVTRALLVGLLAMFLPCGWLYLFVIWAAGTGSPWAGLLVMVAFWAGTVPILSALGIGVQTALVPVRRHLPKITAALLIVIGAVVLQRGLTVDAHAALPSVGSGELSVGAALSRLQGDEDEDYVPPCCQDAQANTDHSHASPKSDSP